MTAVTRFEDLIAWQEARKLMQLAYKVTSEGSFARDFEMRDQFRSAALSAMTNIAEGFDNELTAEFARFLGMARRSAVEVQSLCYAALDVNHITPEIFRLFGMFRDAPPYLATRRKAELIPPYIWRIATPIPNEPIFQTCYNQAKKDQSHHWGVETKYSEKSQTASQTFK